MHVVAVTLTIRPECWDAFLPLMLTNAAASLRDEPDCHQFDVATGDGHRVFLYELYTDAAGFAAHLQMPHFKEFDAAVTPMLLSKDVAQYTRITTPG